MTTETIENGRSFSGDVYREEAPEVVLIDQLECEHISFSKVKRELNNEFNFCSHGVLVEYLINLNNNY